MNASQVIEELIERVTRGPHLELEDGSVICELEIDPPLAKEVLEHLNKKNIRSIRRAHVDTMLADIRNDSWVRNFDAIVFVGDDFMLKNGQHRLSAVVRSGTSLKFLVVISAPAEVDRGQDTGIKRNITQTHNLDAEVAATLRVVIQLLTARQVLTRSEILGLYEKWKEQTDWVVTTLRRGKTTRKASVFGAFLYVLMHVRSSQEREEVRLLGEDLVSGNAQFSMTPYLRTMLDRSVAPRFPGDRCDEACRVIRMIEAHLKGQVITKPRGLGLEEVLRRFNSEARYRGVNAHGAADRQPRTLANIHRRAVE